MSASDVVMCSGDANQTPKSASTPRKGCPGAVSGQQGCHRRDSHGERVVCSGASAIQGRTVHSFENNQRTTQRRLDLLVCVSGTLQQKMWNPPSLLAFALVRHGG